MNIRFDRLETVIEATQRRALPVFLMRTVRDDSHRCGSAGCLIGNYNVHVKRFRDAYGHHYDANNNERRDWSHFGITEIAYYWLYDEGMTVILSPFRTRSNPRTLRNVTKEQAISRVQKFIAYFKRKEEIFSQYYDWRTSEQMRKQEGNWLVCLSVKQALTVKEETVAV